MKAPARAGAIAPVDVIVPKQATTLGPEKTSFFQALQITTKITKGCIEILVSIVNITFIAWTNLRILTANWKEQLQFCSEIG